MLTHDVDEFDDGLATALGFLVTASVDVKANIPDIHISYSLIGGSASSATVTLTARARLAQVIGQIDDEDAQKRIYDSLNWRNKDE